MYSRKGKEVENEGKKSRQRQREIYSVNLETALTWVLSGRLRLGRQQRVMQEIKTREERAWEHFVK